jgi:murein DD-endopeptidase MepM/ murein hydrolase activator NlpD
VDERNQMHRGEEKNNRSHFCYGAQALAVANGVVAGIRDGIPENVPGAAKPAVELTLDTVSGNRVVLDLGRGQFAHYAHLQPGSLRVRKGQRVRTGQVLGLVGNSGGSTAPHLHFQVSRSAELVKGDGLPYVLDRFTHEGKTVKNEIPSDRWVVDFR